MYSQTYLGAPRSTCLIDAEGRVAHAIPKVYRAVVALVDRTLPSVVLGLDRALRCFVWRADLRADRQRAHRAQIVAASRHYGLTIQTCVPADPQ